MKREQAEKLVNFMIEIAKAIRDAGGIPNGHLYAQVMGKMSFDQYQNMIETMKKMSLIKEENNFLTYIPNA